MDVLSDVLRAARLNSTIYYRVDFAAPWGLEVKAERDSFFHVMLEGQCWVQMEGSDTPIAIGTGDIIAFPQGGNHWLADHPARPRIPLEQFRTAYAAGRPPFRDGGTRSTLICGHYTIDRSFEHPLLTSLPATILIRAESRSAQDRITALVQMLAEETEYNRPGSGAIVSSLTETLVHYIHRHYLTYHEETAGFWDTLRDAQIHQALQLIHEQPDRDWTLDEIAHHIGMSRTAFALRFKELAQMTPMRYITLWRLQKARDLLRATNETVGSIGMQVGYQSEAAFIRAFQREFERTPSQFRRDSQWAN